MKTALILTSILSVALLVIFAVKWFRTLKNDTTASNLTIYPRDVLLTQDVLKDHGFKIYPTKDRTYASHPNGVVLKWVEGSQWDAECRFMMAKQQATVYTLNQLVEFCNDNQKPIKQ